MDAETKTYFERLESRLVSMESQMASMDGRMATKDDLKGFATKDDLRELEVRQNQRFATKDDLREMRDSLIMILASKVDLDEVNNNLSQKIDRLDARTDQDIRAVIKDINFLKQAGFGHA